jgi:hypothetical protein
MAFTRAEWTAAVTTACLSVTATGARADEPESHEAPAQAVASPSAPASPDMPDTERPTRPTVDRSWLYLDDARVAEPGTIVGLTSVGYADTGSNQDPTSAPYRGFAANTAQPGGFASLGAEVGVLPRVSLEALGQMQLGGEGVGVTPGAIIAARLELSPPSWADVHLLASAGVLRETWSAPTMGDAEGARLALASKASGADGAWASFAASVDLRRVRLGVTTLGEHVFATGRDPVDIMVQAGASYRVTSWFRAGVEWVGQDLEETFDDEAEGGARHFVGPTAAFQLLQERLTIVAGPSVGLSTGSPRIIGRLALAFAF